MGARRYFIEVAYKGTKYSGFQVQDNAHSVQAAIDQALSTLFRVQIATTGSRRPDGGGHAMQNFLHFDTELPLRPQFMYKINAILPEDIVLKAVYEAPPDAHARFTALGRAYEYVIYTRKDPFLRDRA